VPRESGRQTGSVPSCVTSLSSACQGKRAASSTSECSMSPTSRRRSPNPTILDVAAVAGVSKSVVSRVLSDSPSVSDRSRAAVLSAIEKIGYRPNAAARTLVRRRSQAVGVLVTDVLNPFLVELVDGMGPVAEARGYSLLLLNAKAGENSEEAALNKLLEFQVDGIVCDPVELKRSALLAASQTTALMLLTRTPSLPRVDSIVVNDHAGAALVVDHLAALGHRRIAMVGDTSQRAGTDRMRGYHEAMSARGLSAEVQIVAGGFTEAGGYRAAEQLLNMRPKARPTAIFAANDYSALGVLDAAAAAGLLVPRDLSVVGYDDISVARMHLISLTTVRQAAAEIGAAALDSVLRRMEEPDRPARKVVLTPELIERRTSGPAPSELN
jgi:DNA-binding LacI/PurR family transcriptional regulator